MSLQLDLRFKFSGLSLAIRRTCLRLKLFAVKGSIRRSEQEALALQAMCAHVWRAHKAREPWLADMGLDVCTVPNCASQHHFTMCVRSRLYDWSCPAWPNHAGSKVKALALSTMRASR